MLTIRDMLDMYAYKHSSDNILLLLNDYQLDERLDKHTLDNLILFELGECFSYYNRSDVLKAVIENWFSVEYHNITKLCDAFLAEYNPLYDVNYYEDEETADNRDIERSYVGNKKDTGTVSNLQNDTVTKTSEETDTKDLSDTSTKTINEQIESEKSEDKTGSDTLNKSVDGITENQVSAYDNTNYQPKAKEIKDTDDIETTTYNSSIDTTQSDEKTATENDTRNVEETDIRQAEDNGTFSGNHLQTNNLNTNNTESETTNDNNDENRNLHAYGIKNHTIQELLIATFETADLNPYNWIVTNLRNKITLAIW